MKVLRKATRVCCDRLLRWAGYHYVNAQTRWGVDAYLDLAKLLGRNVSQVFDVGANVGQSALTLSSTFPRARIHSFEPIPAAFDVLRSATAHLPSVTCVNSALAESAGTSHLTFDVNATTLGTLSPEAPFLVRNTPEASRRTIQVSVDTVDRFCAAQGIRHIDLLKIDTEGCDDRVLKGARGMLTEGAVTAILTEFYNLGLPQQPRPGDLVSAAQLLLPLGYYPISYVTDFIDGRPPLNGVHNAIFVRQDHVIG